MDLQEEIRKVLSEEFNKFFDKLDIYGDIIKEILDKIKLPLQLDPRHYYGCIEYANKEFKEVIDKVEKLDISHTYGEIKFIGKRLDAIEKSIEKMKEKSTTKKIDLSFSCDGYEMVKKTYPESSTQDPTDDLIHALKTLTSKEKIVLTHRFGLFGTEPETLEVIARAMDTKREYIRQIEAKALRKLRSPTRKTQVEKITHKALRKAIFGGQNE